MVGLRKKANVLPDPDIETGVNWGEKEDDFEEEYRRRISKKMIMTKKVTKK